MDKMTFGERLDWALQCVGMTNAEFATAVSPERGQQTVNNWRARGKVGWPSQQRVSEILAGIDMQWLMYGKGEKPEMYTLSKAHGVAERRAQYGTNVPNPSQNGRPDFQKMADAVYLAQQFLEIRGESQEHLASAELLEVAYDVVERFGQAQEEPSNVIDLMRHMAKRVQELGVTHAGTTGTTATTG